MIVIFFVSAAFGVSPLLECHFYSRLSVNSAAIIRGRALIRRNKICYKSVKKSRNTSVCIMCSNR